MLFPTSCLKRPTFVRARLTSWRGSMSFPYWECTGETKHCQLMPLSSITCNCRFVDVQPVEKKVQNTMTYSILVLAYWYPWALIYDKIGLSGLLLAATVHVEMHFTQFRRVGDSGVSSDPSTSELLCSMSSSSYAKYDKRTTAASLAYLVHHPKQ